MIFTQIRELQIYIIKKISAVLQRNLVIITNETDLINEGLDSIKIIEFIVALEEDLNIQIDDEDLLNENFSTVLKIESILTNKYGIKIQRKV